MEKTITVKEWIAALRSGKFNQGQGYLKHRKGDVAHYCCLGVGCQLAGYTSKFGSSRFAKFYFGDGDPQTDMPSHIFLADLPAQMIFYTGHVFDVKVITEEGVRVVSELNDQCYSFDQIADYVESTIEAINKVTLEDIAKLNDPNNSRD